MPRSAILPRAKEHEYEEGDRCTLGKLDAASPSRKRRLVVLDGSTPSERQAHEDELMRSGEALASDIFLVTGVPRSPPEFGNWNEPNG